MKTILKTGAAIIAVSMLAACSSNDETPTAENSNALTIDRIYSDPGLNGPSLRGVKMAPDGSRVTYLKAKEDDFLQLDLWEYNLEQKRHQRLVDSKQLAAVEVLSDEEIARRERMRITSKGIVSYQWAKNSDLLLFPLNGDLYVYDLASQKAKQLTKTDAFETDPKISPDGTKVGFIREQNIFVVDIATGSEAQLTTDGKGTIKNGMAEFVAQEEMGRRSGYWWSPSSNKIAYIRVDESPVGIEERYEIDGDSFKVFRQRYPRTGTNNVLNKVGVVSAKGGATTWMDIGKETDIYIGRVNWFGTDENVLVQRQNRAQTQLDLLKANAQSGASTVIHSESHPNWINLHNNLRFLKDNKHFIWGSERDDTMQLFLMDVDGKTVRKITDGSGVVKRMLSVDEKAGWVYFMANYESPLETHLYRAAIKGDSPKIEKLSKREGVHNVSMARSATSYIDVFSSPSQPPQTSFHNIDGSIITWLEENKLDDSHPYGPYWKDHVAPEFGSIKAVDGQDMYYRIYKPANMQAGKKYPVIVDVYGGPHAQRVQKAWASRNGYWHQVMAAKGYVVFSLDNRGSGNRGMKFETPIHKHLGRIEIEDQLKGVDFLKTLDYVDDEKIGIFGWSYGGYMTIMAMFKAANVYSAGVSVAPVTDWRLYDTHYTERYLGHPETNSEGYDASNVFPYVDGYKDNLLIIHGMADDNVLFLNATKLYGLMQNKMLPFEQSNYPGKKHGIRGKATRIHLFNQITEFFDRKLKD